MKKIIFCFLLFAVAVGYSNTTNDHLMPESADAKTIDELFSQFCLDQSIGIYEATYATTGSRERALDSAMAFYDVCVEDEEHF